MTNTATSTPAAACGCLGTCVHPVVDGAVRGTSFEHRQVPAAHDDSPAYEPLVPADEVESFVQSVLRQASGNADRTEFAGTASVSAYESLASHRGVTLETVARAAARGTLADVVRLPAVTPEKRTRRS